MSIKKNLFVVILILSFFSLITKLVFALGTDVTPPDVTITVTCNTTPITILSNDSVCEADTAVVIIEYSDATSGLLTISHNITGTNPPSSDPSNITNGAPVASYSYAAYKTNSSNYSISAEATDTSNNKSPVNTFTFNFPPGGNSWSECVGGDCRIGDDGGGGTTIIPVPDPTTTSCGSTPTYASYSNTTSTTPGIIFFNNDFYSFCPDGIGTCQSRSSTNQWVVAGSVFNPIRPGVMRTSYETYTTLAKQNNIAPTLITPNCSGGLANCELSTSLANGIYTTDDNDSSTTDNLTLTQANPNTGFTFSANKNYVILVNGGLTIKTNIKVPTTSTVTFSVSGDIIIDKTIGEADYTSISTNIEGFYSTDKNFIIEGYQLGCTPEAPKDKRLNIAGSVVVNAGLTNGIIDNRRDLCDANLSCPTFSITERPDFILNAPDFIKHPNYTWQEVAP